MVCVAHAGTQFGCHKFSRSASVCTRWLQSAPHVLQAMAVILIFVSVKEACTACRRSFQRAAGGASRHPGCMAVAAGIHHHGASLPSAVVGHDFWCVPLEMMLMPKFYNADIPPS